MVRLVGTIVVAFAVAVAIKPDRAGAQPYPVKPIRLIVPNAPGGGTDTVARLIAERIAPTLRQQVIVDNRGGGGGRIAAELVARAPKDGYTLLLGSGSTLITGPALYTDRSYDPIRDFAPVSLAGTTAYLLVLHPSLPVRSVRGFELQQFYSVVAPAGTPVEIVQRLNQEIVRHLASDDVKARMAREGVEVQVSTSDELGKLTAQQYAKWTKVIREAGIKAEGD